MGSRYVTFDGFTQRYGAGRTTAYALLSDGKLRAVKCGRRTLIEVASADEYFAALPAASIHCYRAAKPEIVA